MNSLKILLKSLLHTLNQCTAFVFTTIRSILFDVCFYSYFVIYLILFVPVMSLVPRFKFKIFQGLSSGLMLIIRYVLNLKFKIEGLSYLNQALKAPCIIACKHQSAWETIAIPYLINNACIVLKNDLNKVPLFNTLLKNLNMIFIKSFDLQALRSLIKQSKIAKENNRPIVIFPEGTRSLVNENNVIYQPGVGLLYDNLQLPVLPIALNSGNFWGRKSFIKKGGLITLKILPPIEPGFKRAEFMQILKKEIEENVVKINA